MRELDSSGIRPTFDLKEFDQHLATDSILKMYLLAFDVDLEALRRGCRDWLCISKRATADRS